MILAHRRPTCRHKARSQRIAKTVQYDDPNQFNVAHLLGRLQARPVCARLLGNESRRLRRRHLLLPSIVTLMLVFMLLPALNLVNLNTGRIMERSSEIGVRKAFGATSRSWWAAGGRERAAVPAGGLIGLACARACCGGWSRSSLIPYLKVHLNLDRVRLRHAAGLRVRPAVRRDPGLEDVPPRSRPCPERSRVMLRHLLKLTWKRKSRNMMLSLEILLAFAIVFGIAAFGLRNWQLYQMPVGFDLARRLVGQAWCNGEARRSDAADVYDTLRAACSSCRKCARSASRPTRPYDDVALDHRVFKSPQTGADVNIERHRRPATTAAVLGMKPSRAAGSPAPTTARRYGRSSSTSAWPQDVPRPPGAGPAVHRNAEGKDRRTLPRGRRGRGLPLPGRTDGRRPISC
jgi:predicted nucleic acid-binding Zn ribbon protein